MKSQLAIKLTATSIMNFLIPTDIESFLMKLMLLSLIFLYQSSIDTVNALTQQLVNDTKLRIYVQCTRVQHVVLSFQTIKLNVGISDIKYSYELLFTPLNLLRTNEHISQVDNLRVRDDTRGDLFITPLVSSIEVTMFNRQSNKKNQFVIFH